MAARYSVQCRCWLKMNSYDILVFWIWILTFCTFILSVHVFVHNALLIQRLKKAKTACSLGRCHLKMQRMLLRVISLHHTNTLFPFLQLFGPLEARWRPTPLPFFCIYWCKLDLRINTKRPQTNKKNSPQFSRHLQCERTSHLLLTEYRLKDWMWNSLL